MKVDALKTRIRLFLRTIACVLLAIACVGAARPEPAAANEPSIYWGAWIGSHLTGTEAPWDMNAVAKFEQNAGKGVSIINFSSPFANCSTTPCTYYNFNTSAFDNVRAHGSIPLFSWASNSLPVSGNQPLFQLSDVILGVHDAYITKWATAAKSWGHPFFLRFNWEMNGNWFPWSEGVNGNVAGEYVAAWRHVHDIFTSVGALNATWVWCPNIEYPGSQPLAPLYPGDGYVDWTCMDGYNWGTARGDVWKSFSTLFTPTYDALGAIAPSKPRMIAETASTEVAGSKAAWIADALSVLPTQFPAIDAFVVFNKYDDGMDWPIETSGSAQSALAAGIASPSYAANQFAGITASPIPPLTGAAPAALAAPPVSEPPPTDTTAPAPITEPTAPKSEPAPRKRKVRAASRRSRRCYGKRARKRTRIPKARRKTACRSHRHARKAR